jgi:acetyl-CoA carboxylase biotin carboxylase subunit
MIAKLIVHADTREQAIKRMNWALSEFVVGGVSTNIDFQLKLIATDAFKAGDYDNGYLNRNPLV